MNINYYLFWYVDYDDISFQNMISKKKYDDYVERSKMVPLEQTYYKTFIVSQWKDDI